MIVAMIHCVDVFNLHLSDEGWISTQSQCTNLRYGNPITLILTTLLMYCFLFFVFLRGGGII